MKILFVSLGCDKNRVDTECMLGILESQGHEIVQDELEAEVIVVNSCCFINDAKMESIETIIEMGALKETAKLKYLIVTGCLSQRYQEEMLEEFPEVDAVLGTASCESIANVIEQLKNAEEGERIIVMKEMNSIPKLRQHRLLTTGGHFAYMKIAEGCDKRCTYCIIPEIRGKYRSVPMEQLIEEAQELADRGVKELILVAQEITLYGKDLYGEKKLPELLRKLCRINGIMWIRLLYCYPEEITNELIQVMKGEPKVCHYLDIPIQHANNEILKKMGRRTTKEQIIETVERLRSEIPDIALRTTLITGFPGETRKQHLELVEFVSQMKFDRLGVFTYSPEEGTPAAKMPKQVTKKTKESRQAELMEQQQEVIFDEEEKLIGRELWVMIEGQVAGENVYVGRTYRDAPDVDGLIFVNSEEMMMSGDFVKVKVTGAAEYDLMGEVL